MKKLTSEPDTLESSTRAQIKAEIKASKMRYTAKRSEHAEGRNKQGFDSDHSAKNNNFAESGQVYDWWPYAWRPKKIEIVEIRSEQTAEICMFGKGHVFDLLAGIV